MRIFFGMLLALTLFTVNGAYAGCGAGGCGSGGVVARFQHATGGMANINSGTCGGAKGLWDSYCHQGGCDSCETYGYGAGFGAYAHAAPSCGGGCHPHNAWWYGGGSRSGCSSQRVSSGCGCGVGNGRLGYGIGGGHLSCHSGHCGQGGNLGQHLRGMMSRLQCRCRSTGSIWVGGGPLDTYNVVPSYGFEGGVDYGYINSCSSGGCGGGGCSNGGGEIYSDGGVTGEPIPAAEVGGAVMDGGYQDGGYQDAGTVEGPFEGNGH